MIIVLCYSSGPCQNVGLNSPVSVVAEYGLGDRFSISGKHNFFFGTTPRDTLGLPSCLSKEYKDQNYQNLKLITHLPLVSTSRNVWGCLGTRRTVFSYISYLTLFELRVYCVCTSYHLFVLESSPR